MESKVVLREPTECTYKCRSKLHAAEMIAAITRGTEEESLAYLSGYCWNPGKVTDHSGRTLLHVAASVGKRAVVEWLLRFKEAQLNTKDTESGYSALHRSLFHGQLHVTEFLIKRGANAGLQDFDGLTPFDHAQKDRISAFNVEHVASRDTFVWGSNANYNLGLGHHQQRQQPVELEQFRKDGVSCQQVVLQKFHSAFLSADGIVYTCGHGHGGRLGHGGKEQVHLTPKPIAELENKRCLRVALGVDHSLFLLDSGAIWSCGSNSFHQLGISPPPPELSTPQAVSSKKGNKYPAAVGIAAGRFHSLFWTSKALYTWGLNAGHLGHLKGEKTIVNPKLVSSISQDVVIRDVSCSDSAIVVLTGGGDLIALHKYQTRRIASRQQDVVKMEVVGGHLDTQACTGLTSKLEFDLKLVEGGGQDLKVFVLTSLGRVWVWEESRGAQMILCLFNVSRELLIADMAINRHNLIMVSKEGTSYEGIHQSKRDKRASSPTMAKSPGKENTLVKFINRDQCDIIKVKRLPNIVKGVSVECDPKGKNFCVLQRTPVPTRIPTVSGGTMAKDMKNLLAETSEMDPVHDVVVRVGNRCYPAHKYILASASEKLSKQVTSLGDGSSKELEIDDVGSDVFEQILQFVYTRTCDYITPGFVIPNYAPTKPKAETNGNGHLVTVKGDPDTVSAFKVHKDNKTKKKKSVEKIRSEEEAKTTPLQKLQEAARILSIHGLIKALDDVKLSSNGAVIRKDTAADAIQPCFARKNYPELYDVTIVTEDKVEILAHKCILSARLEYFHGMFSYNWIETHGQRLTLPIASKVLAVVIDYLYRDDATAIDKSEDIEFIGHVLVAADQFLMVRLMEICQRRLAQLMTIKLAPEIFQFSCDFNFELLRTSAMEFICQNYPSFLDNRSLETIDPEYLKTLSRHYISRIPALSCRTITPYTNGPSTEEIEAFFVKHPLTVDDLFAAEELAMKNPVVRKRNRRHSSGDKPSPRERKMSGGTTSDSDDEYRNIEKDVETMSLEDFELEEKEQSPPVDDRIGQSVPHGNPDKFLLDFFSPKQSKPDQTKKFVRLSQKQRKKLIDSKEVEPTQEPKVSPGKPTWTGWGTAAADASPSLLDIMKTEATPKEAIPSTKKELKANASTSLVDIMKTETTASTRKESKPRESKKKAWKQLSFSEETPKSPLTITNPWKVIPAPEQPSTENSDAFQDILKDQVKQKENLFKAQSKSLSVTQLEERAMDELRAFYNAEAIFDECITVSRAVKGQLATPVWNRFKK